MQELRRPMTAIEIVAAARERAFFSDKLSGKTPHNTMRARLSEHIKEFRGHSDFVRTGPGRFYLRELADPEEIYDAKEIESWKRSTFLRAAEDILRLENRPMTAREIVSAARERNLFEREPLGRTPDESMKARLSVHVRKLGNGSVFVRTEPGRFSLRELISPERIYEAKPLRAKLPTERVLVFPTRRLDKLGSFQGIKTNWQRLERRLVNPSNCGYLERLEAEQSDSFKQVLTYVMVTKESKILVFKRGNYNTVAEYLRGSLCIGFGGHVSEPDRTLFGSESGVMECAIRELKEELELPEIDVRRLQEGRGLKIVGILNDDSSVVGRRHFAFLFRFEVSEDPAWNSPKRGEKSVTQLHWMNVESDNLELTQFEYWSQLCLRTFFRARVRAQPSFRIVRAKPLKPPHVLCIVGQIGSGKSEATEVLRKEFGYVEINSGKVLAALLGMPPVPVTDRQTFQKAANRFIKRVDGPKRLAIAIWKGVQQANCERVLIDGVRQRSTLDALKRLAGRTRVGLVYIYTPPDVAYYFYALRSKKRVTIQDFLGIRDNPVEGEVEKLMSVADAVVYNWTGRLRYQAAIRNLMSVADSTQSRRHSG
jgi:predicted NUDIX family phosphoesterase